ncbi:hypothetical protein CR513_57416, partial [Mucuna pruriens]
MNQVFQVQWASFFQSMPNERSCVLQVLEARPYGLAKFEPTIYVVRVTKPIAIEKVFTMSEAEASRCENLIIKNVKI